MRKLTDMTTLTAILVLPLALAALLPMLAAAPAAAAGGDAAAPPGLVAFNDLKCNMCHGIETQGVQAKSKTSKAPDLSNAGASHDAAWIAKFLRQEVPGGGGKKHSKKWTGTPEQLQQLSEFLASLKKA